MYVFKESFEAFDVVAMAVFGDRCVWLLGPDPCWHTRVAAPVGRFDLLVVVSALLCSVAAQQRNGLTRTNLETDAVHGNYVAETFAEAVGDNYRV